MKLHRLFLDKGFTLIEILLVVSFIATLAGFGIVAGVDSYQRSTFRGQQDLLIGTLQKARSRAMANIGQCNHMVVIDDEGIVVKPRGDEVCHSESVGEETIETQGNIIYSGPSEIVFLRVLGSTDIPDNEVVITLTDTERSADARIFIGQNGRISWD